MAVPPVEMGYLSLVPAAAARLGLRLVPFEDLPAVTTGIALGIQLIPVLLVACGRVAILRGGRTSAVAAVLILFACPAGEVWLNTVNSQWHLLLACTVILHEDWRPRLGLSEFLRTAVLLLAALSSPTTVVLAPFFVARALKESRGWAYSITAFAGAVLQVLVAACADAPGGHSERLQGVDAGAVSVAVFLRVVVEPFLGPILTGWVADPAQTVCKQEPMLATGLGLLAVCATVGMVRRLQPRARSWLGSATVLAFATALLSKADGDKWRLIDARLGERYFFVPALMVVLYALTKAQDIAADTWRTPGGFAALLIASALFWGVALSRQTLYFSPDWPSWRDQVRGFGPGASPREIAIWPPGWYVSSKEP